MICRCSVQICIALMDGNGSHGITVESVCVLIFAYQSIYIGSFGINRFLIINIHLYANIDQYIDRPSNNSLDPDSVYLLTL